ncbi:hypothetical protein PIB30_103215 [Stylosanthes scabra]|uniref:Uncharacterized protein n=1 Tax=Stylosanthes scabra TaxID=79078 RepID=A0ABU6YYM5_9FABA|nr:hypothetical protein [Stylosanthes scabra]
MGDFVEEKVEEHPILWCELNKTVVVSTLEAKPEKLIEGKASQDGALNVTIPMSTHSKESASVSSEGLREYTLYVVKPRITWEIQRNYRGSTLYVGAIAIAWSFNPRGIDTPLHCGILLDTIRYTCRDLRVCESEHQGSRRDKSIIEFDPEIEKTLKKNRSRVKAQRNLQFEQEEVNSEEGTSENSLKKSVLKKRSKTIWQTIISGELLRITLILLLLVVEAVLFGPI